MLTSSRGRQRRTAFLSFPRRNVSRVDSVAGQRYLLRTVYGVVGDDQHRPPPFIHCRSKAHINHTALASAYGCAGTGIVADDEVRFVVTVYNRAVDVERLAAGVGDRHPLRLAGPFGDLIAKVYARLIDAGARRRGLLRDLVRERFVPGGLC